MSRLERLAAVALGLAAAVASVVALVVWPRLFDSTPPGQGRIAAARCEAGSSVCEVEVLTISRGRHWLEASAPGATRLSADLELRPGESAPTALLVGASADGLHVTVERVAADGAWQRVETSEAGGGARRRVIRLLAPDPGGSAALSAVRDASPANRSDRPASGPGYRLRVSFTRDVEAASAEAAAPEPTELRDAHERIRVEELGLFASEAGLASDDRSFLRSIPDRRLYYGLLARACLWLALIGVAAAIALPRGRHSWSVPAFVFAVTLAAACLSLYAVHNPYWYRARDLRVMLASGPMQEGVGANLNYGMHLGSRFLAGEGLTFGPRWVPWERMPGYGFFGALAGIVAGFTTDLFAIGLASIQLHVLVLAAANAAFAAAALRVMHPALAVATAMAVCFMPNQLANTQADSIMVPLYLLTAAALCLYLERERSQGFPAFRYHLLVHASFAVWFLTRPEGFVGWAALSLILYFRRWRYLLLPAALYLAIGVPWALYKGQYTNEFSMTTNTVGDNAWIGLWQVDSRFRWETADRSYFAWTQSVGVAPTSKQASDRALNEVARFALTYPVYMVHLALHRFLELVDVNLLNGVMSYPHVVYERLRGPALWSLLLVVALCYALPHEARRALFLGWPLLFNLPLFLLFFSDGMRHVAPVTAALFVTALPPLLEPSFYATLVRRRARAATIAAGFVVLWHGAHWVDQAILARDDWRYWTPLLDPAPFAWYLR